MTQKATSSWMPVATLYTDQLDDHGFVTLDIRVEGDVPNDLRYKYTWKSSSGLERGETDLQRVPQFNFLAPHDGRFFLSADVIDSSGTTKSAGTWCAIGDVSDDLEFTRPPIPDDSVEPVIQVDDVSMVFNRASEQYNSLKEYFIALARHELTFKAFRALDHISFTVRRGEAFGLVGTNGSGKSTMLKIIAGVLEASEGTCTVTGSIAPLIELGAGFDMDLTARENIYLNGALLGYRREFIDAHLDDIIEFAELKDFMDMPLKNYSSGMVARIAFAIATITEPDILIVDETLSVGDFLFQQKCQRRIQELIGSGNVTVLLVSHSIDIVEAMCDRVCWIEKGKQRMIGPTDDVCAAYRNLGQ